MDNPANPAAEAGYASGPHQATDVDPSFGTARVLLRPLPGTRIRKKYSPASPTPVAARALALADSFLGKSGIPLRQTASMGRSGFIEAGDRYVVAKGVGPAWGSEEVRRRTDLLRRAYGGGCVRLQLPVNVPYISQFVRSGFDYQLISPRPEGVCRLDNIWREAEVTAYCAARGVPVMRPIVLLSSYSRVPWRDQDRDAFERLVRAAFAKALAPGMSWPREAAQQEPISTTVHSVDHLDLRGGLLLREAVSPFRVCDAEIACMNGDEVTVLTLIEHMARCFGGKRTGTADAAKALDGFSAGLGQLAAHLLVEGLLHCRLEHSFQNVSLGGEIADLDGLFCFKWFTASRAIPFPRQDQVLARRDLGEFLHNMPQRVREKVAEQVQNDADRFGGISDFGLDREKAAAALLTQSFDLFLHAVRLSEVFQVMTHDSRREEISQRVRVAFATGLHRGSRVHGGAAMAKWCLLHGRDEFVRYAESRRIDALCRKPEHAVANNRSKIEAFRVAAPATMPCDPAGFLRCLGDLT